MNALNADEVSISDSYSGDDKEWDDFVASCANSSNCHLSGWRKVMGEVFHHQTFYLSARSRSGELVGVLPLVRQKSFLFGDHLISVPFLNYGGAVAVTGEVEQILMSKASKIALDLGVSHIEFRDVTRRCDEWPVRTDKVCMYLDLPDSPDDLWSAIGSKLRSQIRRPMKEGVEVVEGGLEILDEFYDVLSRNWRDLGSPLYSKRFFASILRAFPDTAFLLVARHGSRPVASGFFLGFHDRLEIPWAASIRDYNRIAVNMALYWEGLKRAIEKGYRCFDFGRSSVDSGTYRFKRQWGAEPRQLYWHYWLRDGNAIPLITPNNPKYNLAIKVWQNLPVSVASTIGPMISKYLP